eukprot:Selendium_serpulae@DN4867_c0_g1_i1.p2
MGKRHGSAVSSRAHAERTCVNEAHCSSAAELDELRVGGAPSGGAPGDTKKVNPTEVYGFFNWIASFAVFGIYMTLIVLPDSVLHKMGITYLPSREWALTIPMYLFVSSIYILIAYNAVNLMAVQPLSSFAAITDSHAHFDGSGSIGETSRIHKIQDIPLTTVNAIIFGRQSREEDDVDQIERHKQK